MATIKDIAEQLGISISTVSKGLNGAPDVSEGLRHTILETAVELGYSNSRTRRTDHRRMAVFIENIDYEAPEQFGHDILLGFRKAAFRAKWGVSVYPVTKEMQSSVKYETFMMREQCVGAFFMGFSLDDPWMQELHAAVTPTILLDNAVPANPNIGCIGTDSEEGIGMAVDHLVSLRHEKIAFLNGSTGSMVSDQRMIAFLSSMSAHGLSVDPQLVVYGYYVPETAKYHVPGFIARGATAILCGNDLIASGVIECCRSLGFRVPEDISVIGFDDLPLASRLDPPLTTVRQSRLELGKSAFYSLSAMTDNVMLSRTLLRPVFMKRGSTAIARPRLAEPYEKDPDSILYRNHDLYMRYAR